MFQEILDNKLVPVVTFNSIDEVNPVLTALSEGGVQVAEICFRTACSKEALKLALEKFPFMLIGAGTVINKEQANDAIDLGAKFIVSPGLSEEVAKVCKTRHIPYIPGVVTPTEIMKALELDLTYLKFFPAGVYGGLKAIKALSSAFPQVKFMPTGGVDNSNLAEFVKEKSIFAIGGSWLIKGDIISNCKEAINIVKNNNLN